MKALCMLATVLIGLLITVAVAVCFPSWLAMPVVIAIGCGLGGALAWVDDHCGH